MRRKKIMKRAAAVLFACTLLSTMLLGCGEKKDEDILENNNSEIENETYSEFDWPDSDIAKLLPEPKSNIGKIEWEASYGFAIDVANTTTEDFKDYSEACKNNGFSVDYQAGDDFYYAYNAEKYYLSLNLNTSDNVMLVCLNEPDEDETDENVSEPKEDAADESKDNDETQNSNVDSKFRKAVDSYEKFFNEYCEFMKKYNESSDTSSMIDDYADYMAQYAETMSKIAAIDEDKLSTEDALYYAEAMGRINEKLLEVGGEVIPYE